MDQPRTLCAFVAQLQQAEIMLLPANEEWKVMIERTGIPGKIAEVTEETYWYFLEVLPPKYQRGSFYAFAEGAEALRLFWQKGKAYFCRQLAWDETVTFCRLAQISLPW